MLDRLVSRRHCTIASTRDGYAARDLDSNNGTYCDGRRVDIVGIHDGSQLQIGCTKVMLSLPWVGRGTAVSRPRPTHLLRHAAMLIAALMLVSLAAVAGAFIVKEARRIAFVSGARPLEVTSKPSRAMVFVDGRYAGLTPTSGISLSPGPHSVRVDKADFQSRTFAVATGDGLVSIEAPLTSAVSGLLTVQTQPEGASVFIDGDLVGTTPLELKDVAIGEHDVRLEKTNYVSEFKTLLIEPGAAASVNSKLKIRQAENYIFLLKNDPNNCSYHCELAHVYLLDRRMEDASRHLRQALDIYARGADTSAYSTRLKWLFNKIYADNYFHWYETKQQLEEMRDEIDRIFLELMAKYPSNPNLCKMLTSMHGVAGRPFNNEMLARFLKIDVESGVAACVATAMRMARHGQTKQAAEILEMAAKAAPDNFTVLYTIGKVHYQAAIRGAKESIAEAVLNLTRARSLTDSTAMQHRIDAYLKRLSKLEQ